MRLHSSRPSQLDAFFVRATMFVGDSPLDAFADVPSAQACRSRCDANRECAAWNFHVNGTQKSECWLLRSPMGAATLTFSLGAEQLAMVDVDGHTSLHAGRFGVVFSRGHGLELRARARVRVPSPLRLKTFRKWW